MNKSNTLITNYYWQLFLFQDFSLRLIKLKQNNYGASDNYLKQVHETLLALC